MSPILLKIFVETLEGSYEVGTIVKKLKPIDELIEYEFIAL